MNPQQYRGGYPPAGGYPPNPGPPGYSPYHTQQAPPGHSPYQSQQQAPPGQKPPSWFSGYYQQASPQEVQALQQWFGNVDRDRSGSIDANELQAITFDGRSIGIPVATKLIAVFDQDRNGTIDFSEYVMMHKFIGHMRQVFFQADADRSGRIESREIFQALQGAGFAYVTMNTVLELLNRFDVTKRGLDWLEFLMMAAHIAHCRSVFEWNDKNRTGWIQINQDQLTQISAFLRS